MVRLTLIARISDGLPLAEGLDRDDQPELRQYDYKGQAKVCSTNWLCFCGVLSCSTVHRCRRSRATICVCSISSLGTALRLPDLLCWMTACIFSVDQASTNTIQASIAACTNSMQAIFKRLSQTPHSSQEPRVAVESGPCIFYYLIDGNVCFLTLAEKGYPKKLAFQYLEELAGEFSRLYGSQVDGVTRPYAFIKFGECQVRSACGG